MKGKIRKERVGASGIGEGVNGPQRALGRPIPDAWAGHNRARVALANGGGWGRGGRGRLCGGESYPTVAG